ncbi:MAG TPA: HU family DNA-binding protein [Actinomycetota bacterium]|nr:HU family DNA-binding protein [Actinomycetota bacterium]
MNKQDLVNEIVRRTDITPRDVTLVLETALDRIRDTVSKGQRVTISGFGSFERVKRAPRLGRNPHTGEPVPIPATYVAAFRPGNEFREAVVSRRRRPAAKTKPRRR